MLGVLLRIFSDKRLLATFRNNQKKTGVGGMFGSLGRSPRKDRLGLQLKFTVALGSSRGRDPTPSRLRSETVMFHACVPQGWAHPVD